MLPAFVLPVTAGDSRPAAAVAVVEERCIQLDAGYLQALRQAVR